MDKQLEKALVDGMDYKTYRTEIQRLFEADQTTNNDNKDSMLQYTHLNIQRMNKWDKIAKLSTESLEHMQAIKTPEIWIALTEGWCGDAAHALPIIHKLSEESDLVKVKYVLRDQHTELMDQHLTNGGRSIPKIIRIDANTGSTIGSWGPRPKDMQKAILDNKASKDPIPYKELSMQNQKWYAKDKGKTIQREFLEKKA
ncbi:MAG: thioredoxin family protein [Saprospiraceae bacterium]|nr:thioredoxin family protein [Saprospiraceae bacterium]